MVTKIRTKTEIITDIREKIKTVKPFVRDPFINSLKYKSKKELTRLSKRIRPDGKYGIYL